MALVNVVVPQLSESVAEATLLTWKKKVGDTITADEILIEVETDKACCLPSLWATAVRSSASNCWQP
jgi:Biotin-requiring enzyme